MSKLDVGADRVLRTNGRTRNWRSRDSTAPTTCGADLQGCLVEPFPEAAQARRVVEVGGERGAERAVVEQRGDQRQGGVGLAHQGQARHPQDVVHAGSPVFGEDVGEDRDDVVDDEVVVVAFERVERGAAAPGRGR